MITRDGRSLEDLRKALEREGYAVQSCDSEERSVMHAAKLRPSLIVLDQESGSADELAFCQALRRHQITGSVPIVLLAPGPTEDIVLRSFAAGADDVVPKPYRAKLVVARVRAILRRSRGHEANPSANDAPRRETGPVVIDHERHQAYLRGAPLPLTLAEFKLLAALVSRPGRVFSREQLLESIAGTGSEVTDRNVDVHVKMVRKKFGTDRDFIQTVRGVGYKCKER